MIRAALKSPHVVVVAALATARNQYVSALIGFNEAQLSLMRALGRPPAAS